MCYAVDNEHSIRDEEDEWETTGTTGEIPYG